MAQGQREQPDPIQNELQRIRRTGALVVVVLALVGVPLFAIAVKGAIDAENTADTARAAVRSGKTLQRATLVAVCLRNNISKAVARIGEERRLQLVRDLGHDPPGPPEAAATKVAIAGQRLVSDLNPLLNCDATFEHSVERPLGVRLPQPVVREYLSLVGRGYVPELRGDSIVSHHRAEQGHADF